MARILVTGGAGVVGSGLTRSLIRDGHAVIVLDDLSSGRRELVSPDAQFIKGSVAVDKDVEKAFAEKPEFVFHLAALFANQNSVERPLTDLDVNGVGTLKVLLACARAGVQKILFASSSCVYGGIADMREENAPGTLDTPYAVTKMLGENYCSFFAREHDLDTVIVRLFNTYGPNEFPGRYRNVIANFFDLAIGGKPLTITGDGTETRDFTFVGDTVAGLKGALLSASKPGDVFNLGTGRETEIRTIAESINGYCDNRAGIVYQPRRSWDSVPRRRAVIERAATTFGYAPAVSIEEGLRKTYEWFRGLDER